MDYSAEQREIIRRIGEVAREIERTAEENQTAQMTAGYNMTAAVTALKDAIIYGKQREDVSEFVDMVNTVTSLTDAMRYSAEMGRLCRQHGDLFREFLDTLL